MQARLLNTAPEKAEADALILPIFEGQSKVPPEATALDKKLKGAVTQLLTDHEFPPGVLSDTFGSTYC